QCAVAGRRGEEAATLHHKDVLPRALADVTPWRQHDRFVVARLEGEWAPNVYGGREDLDAVGFLKEMNEAVHGAHPGVTTIAEESTAWPGVSRPTYVGGLGFGLKWNIHHTLREPIGLRLS